MKKVKYFRCANPSCKLSHTNDVVKLADDWKCPCGNPDCESFREPVSSLTGIIHQITGGRPWLLWCVLGAVAVLAIVLAFSGGGRKDDTIQKLGDRMVQLENRLGTLSSSRPGGGEDSANIARARSLAAKVGGLGKKVHGVLHAKDESGVERCRNEVEKLRTGLKRLEEASRSPKHNVGTWRVDVQKIGSDSDDLASEVLDDMADADEEEAGQYTGILDRLDRIQAEVGSLLKEESRSGPGLGECERILTNAGKQLDQASKNLASFVPKPKAPFAPEGADLRLAGDSETVETLLIPLVQLWVGAEPSFSDEQGVYFSNAGQKIVVLPLAEEKVSAALEAGEVDAYVSGDDLGNANSLTKLQVIAMDALLVLVNDASDVDTFVVGEELPMKLAVGQKGGAIWRHAKKLGFDVGRAMEVGGVAAVKNDRNVVSLALYHQVKGNGGIRLLPVQRGAGTEAQEPTPLKIAAEDYLYSIRIVVWGRNGDNGNGKLDSLMKFILSDAGQDVVRECGYVDLRVKPVAVKVAPVILATLARAVGENQLGPGAVRRLPANFQFAVNVASLDVKGRGDLARIIKLISSDSANHRIVILGFTDSDGPADSNQKLSENRARFVADKLNKNGINAKAAGLGENFPLDTNSTEEGKARNRRAEVWLVAPGGAG